MSYCVDCGNEIDDGERSKHSCVIMRAEIAHLMALLAERTRERDEALALLDAALRRDRSV